jgi:hypothetical protein
MKLIDKDNKEILNVVEIDKDMQSYKVIIDDEVREFILTKGHAIQLDNEIDNQ